MLTKNNIGGDIVVSGRSDGSIRAGYTIQVLPEYNIHCSGSHGCGYKTLTNANNIYGVGNYACLFGNIINSNTIYLYGFAAAQRATIRNISGNVYCGARASCRYVKISNIGGSVIAASYQALFVATIRNVNNSVICFGAQCGDRMNVSNAKNVYCEGDGSCHNATITNVENIYIHGDDALPNTIIISSSSGDDNYNNFNETNLFINGTSNSTFTFYCNDTNKCTIQCQSTDACTSLNLCCQDSSTCLVSCGTINNETINCPNTICSDYTRLISSEPTHYPTKVPIIPTTPPSNIPNILKLYSSKSSFN